MAITHAHAWGMSGMRAAGGLVARVQMARDMKNDEADKHIADKLGVTVKELTDLVIITRQKDLEQALKSAGVRDRFRTVVGGTPVTAR